jgi:pyruvate/2-oxoglutarate dehydrogenase complex dihydrolipoamide dehydrogenase (E3) component
MVGCHMIGAGLQIMIAEAIVARKLETTGHEILKSISTSYDERGCYGSGS